MTALVRSASLTQLQELCAQHGVDARALVSEVGLPSRCLAEPDLMVPAQSVGRLLELAADRCNEPALGLKMAQSRRLSNLGPLGLLVRDEPTLRRALEAIMTQMHLHNEALWVRTEQIGNLVVIRAHLNAGDRAPYRQATELVIGVMHRTLTLFMGADWRPRLVCFTHRAARDLSLHRQVFGDAVEFGHDFDGMVCNSADLDAPNPGADPVMARYTSKLLEQPERKRTRTSDRVREFIVLLLPRGHCRVEVVAQHLGVDRRTVARRLAAEGTTFAALVEAIRDELLSRYLKDGSRSLADVSALLGFSDPASFSRWHRNRFGATPRSRIKQ